MLRCPHKEVGSVLCSKAKQVSNLPAVHKPIGDRHPDASQRLCYASDFSASDGS
jgi:hypothetical protein